VGVAALLLATACVSEPTLRWSADTTNARGWSDVRAAWTRKGALWDAFEGRVFAQAIPLAPPLVAAWEQDRALRQRTPSSASTEPGRSLALAVSPGTLVVFAAITPQDQRWADTREGSLEFFLVQPDGVRPALSAQRLSEDELSDLRPWLPMFDALASGFRLVFEVPPDVTRAGVSLRVVAPPGAVDLKWRMSAP
jgi:hypothetical protein